ncbi:two-component system sensor histidine kinase MtrB [Microterricola gilva]|uniref:Sensor histidine kinase MtrB n=1 Tax=Microterricola gilva TaxID=393267 RepID=A0A4Q8AIU6_9MICO|nr:MtrAB system histidine kinase MtrB [Microterricola gilva]RZU64387.1 two-component system sensor histidine kinase MtrB [Microterricola gilva]
MAVRAGARRFEWRSWRSWPQQLGMLWRQSLQFRTVLISLGLSSVAILLTGIYLSTSVSNNLFQARLEQVLGDSARAVASAQQLVDASDATDRAAVLGVMNSARNAMSTGAASRQVAGFRVPGQEPSSVAPLDFVPSSLRSGVITPELRESVREHPDEQFWQSVSLQTPEGGTVPGIVVGSQLVLPTAGRYEIYIAYSLADAEQTLGFVQQTAGIAAIALLLLIGAVTWVVVRLVVTPIRVAAETSERLAEGELEVRIPEKGEDVIATLARSFNGMADSLQAQISKLADLSEVQQRFVSDVSHELRTPLTTIRLAGDVLYDQRASFPPATERTAELLHTQVERFELLLADLLEISRYDAGSVGLDLEATSLVHIAEETIETMSGLAEQNGTEVRLVAPGGHLPAELDPRRIRRIVSNLLGNAIEHSEGKPIIVTVDSTSTAVALTVRDYGVGMKEHEAALVFDRFWRADPSRKRTIGGTGLGLPISLEDALLHGGTIDVWSAPRAGSAFRVTLPRVHGRPMGESPVPLPPEDAGATRPAEPPVRPVDEAEEAADV